jgi:hypothetical protein
MVEVAGEIPGDIGGNESQNAEREAEGVFKRQKLEMQRRGYYLQVNSGVHGRPSEPTFEPCRVLDENSDPPEVG